LQGFIEFLAKLPEIESVKNHPFAMAKAIETLANLGSRYETQSPLPFEYILNRFGVWLATQKANFEICTLFLDALYFFNQRFNNKIHLSQETTQALNVHFAELRQYLHPNEMSAIASRWNQAQTHIHAA
jgi:hypothetical protein